MISIGVMTILLLHTLLIIVIKILFLGLGVYNSMTLRGIITRCPLSMLT
jgi:hypothetical protein